ncbi:MAG: nucleotidyltransferase family protein [Halopseudomonas aestusnigri]
MKHRDQLITTITSDPVRLTGLKAVRDLNLPDCWIAAGFIRNFIWDQLSKMKLSSVKSDIDIIYFDPKATRQKTEQEVEKFLQSSHAACSDKLGSWSVKNQAACITSTGIGRIKIARMPCCTGLKQ